MVASLKSAPSNFTALNTTPERSALEKSDFSRLLFLKLAPARFVLAKSALSLNLASTKLALERMAPLKLASSSTAFWKFTFSNAAFLKLLLRRSELRKSAWGRRVSRKSASEICMAEKFTPLPLEPSKLVLAPTVWLKRAPSKVQFLNSALVRSFPLKDRLARSSPLWASAAWTEGEYEAIPTNTHRELKLRIILLSKKRWDRGKPSMRWEAR